MDLLVERARYSIFWRVVGYLVLATLILLLLSEVGRAINTRSNLLGILFIGIVAAIIAIKPMWGVYYVLIGSFSLDWLVTEPWFPMPAVVKVSTDVVILLLTVIVLIPRIATNRFRDAGLSKYLWSLVGMFIVSAFVINKTNPIVFLVGSWNYMRYVLFFYILMNIGINLSEIEKLVNYIVPFYLTQVVVSVWRWKMSGAIHGTDEAGGTLARHGTNLMVFVAGVVLCVAIGWLLYEKKKRKSALVLLAVLFVPIIVGGANAAFWVFPVLLIFLLFMQRHGVTRAVLAAGIFIPLYLVGIYAFEGLYKSDFLSRRLKNPSWVYYYEQKEKGERGLGRLAVISFANRMVCENPLTLMFGYGAGAASPNLLAWGDIYARYGSLNIDRNQLAKGILELGYVGIGLYFLIIMALLMESYRIYVLLGSGWKKSMALACLGSGFLFTVLTVYTAIWTATASSALYWTMHGLLFRMRDVVSDEVPY